jgi:hypothetical protein
MYWVFANVKATLPVQEDERLLPENDEDGVAEFRNLRQDEEKRPEAGDAIVLDEAEKMLQS